jgi:hypothetical protein
VTRNALLGLAVIVFCIAGLAVGITRVAPGSDGIDVLLAIAAAVVGVGVFVVVLRLGRRGAPGWAKWLLVPALIAAYYLDRLSERWQLVLLALAAGYVGAFVATIVARVVRTSR